MSVPPQRGDEPDTTDQDTARGSPCGPACRLAVYGTLAPGRSNHGQLADLRGRWIPGAVSGHLYPNGTGAALGYPAIVLDDQATRVPVQVFESSDLPDHWSRLDEFEGTAYRRIVTMVDTTEGRVAAHIYELAPVTD